MLIETMRHKTGPKDHGPPTTTQAEYAGPGAHAIRACLNVWHGRPLTPAQREALAELKAEMRRRAGR